jgi:nitrogen regulatory protein P-II 1
MKKIEALLKPYQLDPVKAALYDVGLLPGVTSTELRGYVSGVAERAEYRGVVQIVDLLPRIKIEIIAHDDLVDRIVETIQKVARSGRPDDGEIWIGPVAEVVRIRTGEIDEAALA